MFEFDGAGFDQDARGCEQQDRWYEERLAREQAHEDAQQVQISSRKISQRFAQIEGVELDDEPEIETAKVLKLGDGGRDGA